MSVAKTIFICLSLILVVGPNCYYNSKNDFKFKEEKQKGAHIFGSLDSINIQPFIEQNIEWLTLVPFSDQEDFDSPFISFHGRNTEKGIRRWTQLKQKINLIHDKGLSVFLKPHVWIYNPSQGKWRADIFPSSEENWKLWQKKYTEFILNYANLAEETGVELFCVGTEFTRLSMEKPTFWKQLIQEVRKVYTGKLTYAANWYQEYEAITFWDELDYIGIQAYFPIAENVNPNLEEINTKWKGYLPTLKATSQEHNRKILFTEMGYKSTEDAGIRPWVWIDYSAETDPAISLETQANCYQAFFDSVWDKNWFAGVHFWQMRTNSKRNRGKNNLDFTPQNKPASEVISKGFE